MNFFETLDQMGEDAAIRAIKHGINIRDDFWDDFIQVMNASEEMSDLLGIPEEKIQSWANKVQNALAKVKKTGKHKKRAIMLKTGRIS